MRHSAVMLWLGCVLHAQISEGPFVGAPITFAVSDSTTLGPTGVAEPSGYLAPGRLFAKRAGYFDMIRSPASSGALPDFRIPSMFGAGRPPNFRLDAISSGFHYVWADFGTPGLATLSIPAGPAPRWGALWFSVTKDSPGGDAAAVVAEHLRDDGAGADLFTVVLPGSSLPTDLACVPIGEAQRANDSGEMGFGWSATDKPELGDFDPFLLLYEAGFVGTGMLPANPWVYFSVPTGVASAPALASWFATRSMAGLPTTTPSGATILRTQWNSAALAWSPPEVFLTWQELGLAVTDDIDALAVDEGGRVLVSLRKSATRTLIEHQLMVAEFQFLPVFGVLHPALPYVYDSALDGLQPVGKLAGAGGGGDVDAVCEIDPANGVGSVASSFVRDCRTGVPFGTTMHASVFATVTTAPTTARYAVSVTGLPVTLGTSLYGLVIGFPGPQGLPMPLGSGVTYALGAVTDANQTVPWTLPRSPQGGFWGTPLDFQWAALDGSTITLARVVRISL